MIFHGVIGGLGYFDDHSIRMRVDGLVGGRQGRGYDRNGKST